MIVRATAQSTKWLMFLGLGLIGLVLVLGFSVSAQGVGTAQIEVIPPIPTSGSDISIRAFGEWPSSCIPHSPQVSTVGNQIFIDTLTAAPGTICLTVVTSWEETVFIGPLPAGTYAVIVTDCADIIQPLLCRLAGRVIGERVFTVGLCGDQNDDGKVDVFDALFDLQIIVGKIQPTEIQLILSDVNRDSKIDIFDVILVLKHIVGEFEITQCGAPPG